MPRYTQISLRSALALTTAAIAWNVPVQPAHAQSAGNSTRIEEIIVTADKRKENIQKVPIAITSISAASAAKLGITDTQSLVSQVPGLNWNRQSNSAIPFLRGVGTPVGQPGDEPSVAFYVDDIYIPAGTASLGNFNSVDNIEVDKGPQGTLFGRNATGGVVQVRTKDPTPTPHLDLTLGYANYNTPSASVYATGALTSKVSANLAMYWSHQYDGWGHNPVAHTDTFKQHDDGGRAKILFQPDDNTSILATLDYDHSEGQEGLGFRAYPGTTSVPGIAPPSGYYDAVENEPSFWTSEQYGVALKIKHTFDWAKFQSITSWRGMDANQNLDEDAGPVPLVNTYLGGKEKTQSQELQLSSPDGSQLAWTTGLFYYNDYVKVPYYFTGLAFLPLPFAIGQGTQSTASYAAFGQATATVMTDTHLTAGLRYTIDKRKYDATVYQPAGFGPGSGGWEEDPGGSTGKQWTKLTYRLTLDHQFTQDTMGYIGYNRGFKSGLYNTTVFGAHGVPAAAPVAPEVLDAYTIGTKSELFDHRLRLNVEGFYYQYRNIQIDDVLSGVTILTNAAKATIKGIDLDMSGNPIQHLHLSASLEVMDGHYDSFPNGIFFNYHPGVGGNGTSSVDLAGKHTIQTPPFSMTLTGGYTIPSSVGPFNINLTYFHGGNYYADPDNGAGQVAPSGSQNDRQAILNLVNATAGWDSDNGRYGVRLWAKNLTNQKYWSFSLEDAFTTQYSPAPPLTFGITLQLHLEPGTSPVQETTAAAAPVEIPAAAPAPAPEAQRAFQVFFDFDKSNITSAAAETIQKAADEVNAGHLASINVTGHTDTVGSDAYNQKLSEKRAAAVKKQLQADGVSSSEIATVGVGKSGLLVPTPDGTREPQNRRAEIVLH